MKKLTLFLILLGFTAFGQGFTLPIIQDVITDSIVWRLQSVDNPGDSLCRHDWVYGEPYDAMPGQYCCVNHNGFHCDWRDQVRGQICRKCLRKETWREHWYQHRYVPPVTEYERLLRQMTPKDTVYINTSELINRRGQWLRFKGTLDSIVIDSSFFQPYYNDTLKLKP